MHVKRSSIWAIGGLIGLWILLGLFIVPHLLESAYDGSGFSLLNRALQDTSSASIDFLLAQWREIVVMSVPIILALGALVHMLGRPGTTERITGEATPADLGAIRMLVCGILLASTIWEDLASTAALPRELVRPMGILQVFYLLPIGFSEFAASPTALFLFEWFTAAILFLGLIGWKTRLVLPIGAVCYLILGGLLRQYAWLYHTGLIALYLLIVLSILPSHQGASMDRLVKLWKGESVPPSKPSLHYGWMRYALWTTLAVPYVMAGLSKLRNGGLYWWEASNFKFILYQSTLRPMEFDFDVSLLLRSAPDIVFEILALSAVLGELLYGLVLFSRLARWVMPTVMLLMHLAILFLQNILFFDLILLQIIFFNLRPIREIIAGFLARRKDRLQLVFDRDNPRHQRLVRVLAACDLFDRIDPPTDDAVETTEGRTAPGEGSRPGSQRPAVLAGVYGSKSYCGADLWRLISHRIPILWPAIPAMYVLKWLQYVSLKISNQPRAATSVSIGRTHAEGALADRAHVDRAPADPVSGDRSPAGPTRPGRASFTPRTSYGSSPTKSLSESRVRGVRWRGQRLTVGIIYLLVFLWLFRVEFYPFTGMQMFSKKRSEPVSYVIARAHLRSGEVVRAPIEKSIRSMSDSRYRRVLEMAFDSEREHVSAAFFESVLERWNQRARSDTEQIVGFEVQRWEWYFDSDPDDSAFGHLIESTIYPGDIDVDIDFAPASTPNPTHNRPYESTNRPDESTP